MNLTESPLIHYLVETEADGSTEHGVVLMDGTVIIPKLKQRKPAGDG